MTTTHTTTHIVSAALAVLVALAGAAFAVFSVSDHAGAWHCTLSADPSEVVRGESVTLTWDAANDVSYVTIDGIDGEFPQDGSTTVTPEKTTTYVARTHVDWTEDTLKCKTTVTVVEPEAPVCTLSADVASVEVGDAATLTWTSEHADAVIADGFVAPELSGSVVVSPTEATTYSATFTGAGGEVTCDTHIDVEVPQEEEPTPPTCPLSGGTIVEFSNTRLLSGRGADRARGTAVPVTLEAGTYKVELVAWDGYNSRVSVTQPTEQYQVVLGDVYTGASSDVPDLVREATTRDVVNDELTLSSPVSSVYPIHATPESTDTPNSVVPICASFEKLEKPEPVAPACPLTDGYIVEFSDTRLLSGRGHAKARGADVAIAIPAGTYEVELVGWDGYNTRVNVTQPLEQYKVVLGSVHTGASSDVPDMVREATTRDVVNTELVLSEAVSSVYAKHAFWESTDTPNSIVPICAAFKKQEEPTPAPVCEVIVADTIIDLGASTTLTWTSEHTVSTSFDQGIGSTTMGGSQGVSPTETTTYTGTFVGENGDTIACDATVTVVEEPEAPVCSLTVSPASITTESAEVTVSWSSQNTVSGSIDQNIGSVELNGSTTTTPGGAKTYTATFLGENGDEVTCSDNVVFTKSGGGGGGGGGGRGVCLNCDDDDDDDTGGGGGGGGGGTTDPNPEPEVTVASRVVKATPGTFITLDQVPYTGFEASPLVTALFWAGLFALSMVLSYVLVVKNSLGALVGALVGGSADGTPGYRDELVRAHTYHAQSFDGVSDNGGGSVDVEGRAQQEGILFSPEAQVRVARIVAEEGESVLDELFALAKKGYQSEDGWILLSKDRTETLLSKRGSGTPETPASAAPAAGSPLAAALSTLTGEEQPAASPAPRPQAAPAAQQQAAASAPTAAPAPVMPRTSTSADVATFVRWIVEGKQQEVYEYLRSASSVAVLIGEVVRELDEVYKNRIEGGREPKLELVQLTASWSNPDFEAVIGTLVESVDYSYQSSRIGTKVALAKLFERFGK